MAGTGNREVILWQVRYFVRVRHVDVYLFVAGAGNREVASCGGGSLWHWDRHVSGRCLGGMVSRNFLAGGVLDACAPIGFPAGLLEEVSYEMLVLETLTREFWRKSRMKCSFWRLDA